MSESGIARDVEGGCPVFRVLGVFDRAAAWLLRAHLEREPGREIVLDFTPVREFSDLAVAVLAHGLQACRAAVRVRGLTQHQLRIFRYCGMPLEDRARDAAPAQAGPAHPG